MSSLALHRLGGKLINDFRHAGLTPRQEWLFQMVCDELEYRGRRRIARDRCTCLLCVGPFADEDGVPLGRLEALTEGDHRFDR